MVNPTLVSLYHQEKMKAFYEEARQERLIKESRQRKVSDAHSRRGWKAMALAILGLTALLAG
jgi:hypothetical protein